MAVPGIDGHQRSLPAAGMSRLNNESRTPCRLRGERVRRSGGDIAPRHAEDDPCRQWGQTASVKASTRSLLGRAARGLLIAESFVATPGLGVLEPSAPRWVGHRVDRAAPTAVFVAARLHRRSSSRPAGPARCGRRQFAANGVGFTVQFGAILDPQDLESNLGTLGEGDVVLADFARFIQRRP